MPAKAPVEALSLTWILYGAHERLSLSYRTRLWDELCGSEQDVYIHVV